MYLWVLRVVILLSARAEGVTVKELVAQTDVSKYRARLIVREIEQAAIIVRKGNTYYYNQGNALATVIFEAQNPGWLVPLRQGGAS